MDSMNEGMDELHFERSQNSARVQYDPYPVILSVYSLVFVAASFYQATDNCHRSFSRRALANLFQRLCGRPIQPTTIQERLS